MPAVTSFLHKLHHARQMRLIAGPVQSGSILCTFEMLLLCVRILPSDASAAIPFVGLAVQ